MKYKTPDFNLGYEAPSGFSVFFEPAGPGTVSTVSMRGVNR